MKRRDFVGGLAIAAGLGACSSEQGKDCAGGETAGPAEFQWNMVTAWPPGLPGLGTGAAKFAADVGRASGGRLTIKVFAGGELVPALEVFDAVSRGVAQMGHDPSYYHRGKVPAAQYFTAIPFGQNANEINAWVYYGGGLELWHELYGDFNLVPFPVGQTGVQMAGWFNREIRSVEDLVGLKMRIPGLGGEVMQRAGAMQVTIPASEIFTSLQSGAIDAAEWVGPYNDVSLGLHRVAKYYYYPGWHEPGPMIECVINKDAWNSLPDDLQQLLKVCCRAANLDTQAEYTYGNALALEQLLKDPNVKVLPLPEDVLELLKKISREVVDELSAKDPWSARIQESFDRFQAQSMVNQMISEQAYVNARTFGAR